MKKIFILLFLFIIFIVSKVYAHDVYSEYIFHQNEILFNRSMLKIDVIDPVISTNYKGINYPGLRGANQLVIYTPSYGLKTGTNEFGTEAIVEGDTVVSLSGANSLIPANGFVISGHGNAKKWINENIMVGSKIYLDVENKILTSYITSETFLFAARERIKEVQDMTSFYFQTYANYNSKQAELNLNKANDFILKAQKHTEDSQKYSSKAIEYANKALANAIPYDIKELKGVWIRPTYFTRRDIENVLDLLEDVGINNVFLETYYHGKTIFPSKTMERYGFIKQYEDYEGFDPLKIWISEAHKRNIKINIWFQTFYVGNKSPEINSGYILAKHPDWANYQKKNANSSIIPYSVSEHNGYFLDPANPEVQNFLYELLTEIICDYRPDGINLDYIRYPQSLSSSYSNYDLSNWGYTNFARAEFKQIYGVDPIEIKPNDYLWDYWKYYRCKKVTDFVKKASELSRAYNIDLTAVIFPNRMNAIDTKLQDWKNWSTNNFVNGFTPLFLTCDDKTIVTLIEDVLRNKSASTKLYAGLFVTFMNGSSADLIKQIHVARKYSLNGIIVFDYAHLLNNDYIETLQESAFKVSKKDEISIKQSDLKEKQEKKTKKKKERRFGKRRK